MFSSGSIWAVNVHQVIIFKLQVFTISPLFDLNYTSSCNKVHYIKNCRKEFRKHEDVKNPLVYVFLTLVWFSELLKYFSYQKCIASAGERWSACSGTAALWKTLSSPYTGHIYGIYIGVTSLEIRLKQDLLCHSKPLHVCVMIT